MKMVVMMVMTDGNGNSDGENIGVDDDDNMRLPTILAPLSLGSLGHRCRYSKLFGV